MLGWVIYPVVYRKPPYIFTYKKDIEVPWIHPLMIPSHHPDYYIFSLGNLKLNLSFATGILGGGGSWKGNLI